MPPARNPRDGSAPIIAIGDVHGCADELDELLKKIPITRDTTLVFLGDYIDRGPKSRDVVELILEASERCHVVTLTGNHEEMFQDFLADPTSKNAVNFIYNGGGATLASYSDGVGGYTIPSAHLAFFRDLQLTYQSDDYFFVHAGVPNVPLEELDIEAYRRELLWVRKTFLESTYRWSKLPVHGHSCVREVDIRPNRINVDSGCVNGGALSAIVLPTKQVYAIPRRDEPHTIVLRDPGSRRIAVRFPGKVPVHVTAQSTTIVMESVNYNEFGMLLHDREARANGLIYQGDPISGNLVVAPMTMIPFSGSVVRGAKTPEGLYFGVKFDGPLQAEL